MNDKIDNKVLFLDSLPLNSRIQVGSHKYASLFKRNGYSVFSLSHYVSAYRLLRRNSEDRELIRSWISGARENSEGIYSYSPFCLFPYISLPPLNSLTVAHNCLRSCIPGLGGILKDMGFTEHSLLFINNIKLVSVLNFVKPKMKVLRISDRVEGFGNAPSTILRLQNEAIKTADLVLATSKRLAQEAGAINPNTLHLPNGVDHEFIEDIARRSPFPYEYQNIKRPIIIYMGAISDWFDYELYEHGLKEKKNSSFVMIGPIGGKNYRKNRAKICHFIEVYKNFHYLGVVPHSDIRKYLAHADAGLIPFKLNSLTNEINPVKFFEYAACGLSTIASPMLELRNYENLISFYVNKDEYNKLLLTIPRNKELRAPSLIQFARNNTWERRFEVMLREIESFHQHKKRQF